MLRWKLSSWTLGTALGCSLWGSAGVPAAEPVSPLERLKQRSAESRWLELKDSLLQTQPERQQPQVEPLFRTELPVTTRVPSKSDPTVAPANLGTWRNADEDPLPQFQSPAVENVRATTAPPVPDVLEEVPVVSSEAPPALPEDVPGLPARELQNPRSVAKRQADVPQEERPFAEQVAPRRHIGVPNPYPPNETTLAEADNPNPPVPEPRPDSADALPDHRPFQLDKVFHTQADGHPLIVPKPQHFLPDTERPRLVSLPPAPVELAQIDTLPAPIPKEESDRELRTLRPITEIEPFRDYAPSGAKIFSDGEMRVRAPDVLPLPARGTVDRTFAPTQFQWEATNVFHNPLYFEDVELERYGHSYPWGLQPAASIAKFGVQAIGLPYTMAMDPIWQEHYALGYYRPGDCAPKLHYQIPLDKKAAITAAGVYTGLFFIFP